MIARAIGIAAVGALACGGESPGAIDAATTDAAVEPDAPPPCDPSRDYTGVIPPGASPCTDAVRWPHVLRSSDVPAVVHFPACEHADTARQVLELVEYAWRFETEELGFSAPLPDGGECGPDEAFDVFVWPDAVEAYVQAIGPNDDTPHDDWRTFMVIDPWGPYGGALLGPTIAHELNHACQAADDWWEHIAAFELTATFVEALAHANDDAWTFVLDDFQAHPDWSVDRDDGYETWHMYGASLLLHFVRERYFAGDASFAGDMWRRSRNPPGDNEPDFEDALDDILQERAGVGFADAVGELAAWRWYTGERDDGMHFAAGSLYPRPAIAATVDAQTATVDIDPMIYGTAYIDVTGTGTRAVAVDAPAAPAVRWLVQAVPGTDGATADILDPAGDVIDLDGFALRTVVITALPSGGDRDPDEQTDARFAATLVVGLL